jgi:hypoxanthine phosphoribosyltransferase
MSKSVSPNTIKEVSKRANCLIDHSQIELALDDMAEKISNDLRDSNPVVLCVLIGGIIPTGSLLTRLDFPLQVDYIHATRYGDMTSGANLEWIAKPTVALKDRVILVVDDILDGGVTLSELVKYCNSQGAKEVKTAVLVEKNVTRESTAVQKADYTGVNVDNHFVYGYGMDYKRYLRNAPGIYAVAKEDE